MANTRDTLGDQATLDALVADTLSSFEENNLKDLRQYGIYKRNTLQTLKLGISNSKISRYEKYEVYEDEE